jgi:hypothetical protein
MARATASTGTFFAPITIRGNTDDSAKSAEDGGGDAGAIVAGGDGGEHAPEHDDRADGGEDDPERHLGAAVSFVLRLGVVLRLTQLGLAPRGRIGRGLDGW